MKLFYRKYPHSNSVSENKPGHGTGDAAIQTSNADSSPLIILHGLFGAGGNWHSLSANRFSKVSDVYVVDQRNHGRSPHSDSFTFNDMVSDLLELLDDLDIDTVSILGHSMGGKTAMHFALTYPDRVDRLVIADVSPVPYPDKHAHIFKALRSVQPGKYGTRQEIDAVLAETLPTAAVRQFLMKNLVRKAGGFEWMINLEVIQASYVELREEVDGWPPFTGETLFLKGELSDYISEKHYPAILRLFPEARIEVLKGTGHWMHADAPESFADAVLGALVDGSMNV